MRGGGHSVIFLSEIKTFTRSGCKKKTPINIHCDVTLSVVKNPVSRYFYVPTDKTAK